jgi:hypothetical protein
MRSPKASAQSLFHDPINSGRLTAWESLAAADDATAIVASKTAIVAILI